jgi:hypothetical protein
MNGGGRAGGGSMLPGTVADQDGRVAALVEAAHAVGAAMVVSGYFCMPGTYWADVIAPGRVTVARGGTAYEAAKVAFDRFTAASRRGLPLAGEQEER